MYVFYISLFLLLYTYVGYGMLVYIINLLRKKRGVKEAPAALPEVTLIIPAYNEADWLPAKIDNCLQLDYPADKLQIIFVTDGSTDESLALLNDPRLTVLHEPNRKGKMAAINRGMQYVTSPIVVFSDANTVLNRQSLLHMVAHYANEKVGGVAGEKKIKNGEGSSIIGFGEGLYWQYESMLKQLDSDFNTVVGAAGELFSMRTSLFRPQDEQVILDDFMLSMQICINGYKVVYEPKAFAQEVPSADLSEEKKRRVRIAAGAFQTIAKLWPQFMLVKRPLLYFQYFSRRIMRWLVCPPCLLVCFISNGWLAAMPGASLPLKIIFFLQILFYGSALVGGLLYRKGMALKVLFVPFYFMFMNLSLVEGFIKYCTRKQTVLWDKSRRRMLPLESIN